MSTGPSGRPRSTTQDGSRGHGDASAQLSPLFSAADGAILVVDRVRRVVSYANPIARRLVSDDLSLPVGVDEWSAAAGLTDAACDARPPDGGHGNRSASPSSVLRRIAQGESVLGEAVVARRAAAGPIADELLWVIGLPMTDAPESIGSVALVALLPMRDAQLPAGTPVDAGRLRDQAALATSVSFTITDATAPDNPLVWVNPAFTATTGYRYEESVGRNCRFLQGPDTDRRVVASIRQSLQNSRPITTTLLNYRKDGTPFWNELSVSPIVDESGAVTHFVGVQADVTGRIDAQRARDAALSRAEIAAGRLALIADFATRLTASLDADAITHLLADMLVPQLGSWCVVHLKDADGRTHTFVEHERLDVDTQVKELVSQLNQAVSDGMPPDNPSRRVLRGELTNLLVSEVNANPAAAGLHDDDISAIARQLGVASVLMVPLVVRDRILGAVTIVADGTRPRFEQADLSLAQELASRAALMLENSRLYAHERTAAVSLQRSLLPLVPQLPGFTVATEYLTATDQAAVGGDWYDIFAVQDGSIGVCVGDAMGHNFDSAAAMGKLSTMLRAYAWPGAPAGETLDAVDRLITGTDANYLATCFYGVLRPTDDGVQLEYASAGHPAPILRHADGSTEILDARRGAMLGVLSLLKHRARPRESSRLSVRRGSTLVVFTDGLTDSMGDDVDVTSAVELLALMIRELPTNATPQTLVSALAARADGGRKDDVAIIAVRVD